LTEGSPCIDPTEFDYPEKSIFNKLLRTRYNLGCQTILNEKIIYDERYRYITSEANYVLFQNKSSSVPKNWGVASTMNLYQRSYVNWSPECYLTHLSPQEIYEQIGAVSTLNTWQSIFNFVSLLNILIAFCIFGLISWIFTAYKLILKKPDNKYMLWFGTLSTKWTTGMSILKILLVYICVSYIDKYENELIKINSSDCADPISNQCFQTLGTSLLESRVDDLFVFKLTMLMLTFEIINFLTPKIVHLRKQQGKKIKMN